MVAHNEKDERFFQTLKDKVYAGEFKELNGFEYSCFKFKFKIDNQQYLKEFSNFIYYHNPLLPWELGNFLLNRGIKFKLRFRYCKEIGFKCNYILFKAVVFINKELIKLYCAKKLNKFISKMILFNNKYKIKDD